MVLQGSLLDLHNEDEADDPINTSLERVFIKVSITDSKIANNFVHKNQQEHVKFEVYKFLNVFHKKFNYSKFILLN